MTKINKKTIKGEIKMTNINKKSTEEEKKVKEIEEISDEALKDISAGWGYTSIKEKPKDQ